MNSKEYLALYKYSDETLSAVIKSFEKSISTWEHMISVSEMPETIDGLNILIKVHRERIQIYKKILQLRVFE